MGSLALAVDTASCSWARYMYFTRTVPLSTQVFINKWVLVNLMLGVGVQWTSIPSMEE